MPISATINHDEAHWKAVLVLVHRAIEAAGMEPRNVWAASGTDRITERIVSNLFEAPIVACDISDLNANVMLELGMRLASKKPTVVIADGDSSIPFDIKDFEVLRYPSNLSMLAMETFLDEFAEQLRERYEAFQAGNYKPFMAGIETIELAEPKVKEVEFETLVARRLDELTAKIDTLRWASPTPPLQSKRASRQFTYIVVPVVHETALLSALSQITSITSLERLGVVDERVAYSIGEGFLPNALQQQHSDRLNELAKKFGGQRGLPVEFQELKK